LEAASFKINKMIWAYAMRPYVTTLLERNVHYNRIIPYFVLPCWVCMLSKESLLTVSFTFCNIFYDVFLKSVQELLGVKTTYDVVSGAGPNNNLAMGSYGDALGSTSHVISIANQMQQNGDMFSQTAVCATPYGIIPPALM